MKILVILSLLVASVSLAEPVTPQLVAGVHKSLQKKAMDWVEADRIAGAINTYEDPHQLLAMAIWESDLNPLTIRESPGRVFDVGLLGIRCRLEAKVAQGGGPWSATNKNETALGKGPRIAKDQLPSGRCVNSTVRGIRLRDLLTPEVNIAAAIELIALKKQQHPEDWMTAYNGGTSPNRYGLRISGVQRSLLGHKVQTNLRRLRDISRLILKAREE